MAKRGEEGERERERGRIGRGGEREGNVVRTRKIKFSRKNERKIKGTGKKEKTETERTKRKGGGDRQYSELRQTKDRPKTNQTQPND